MKLLPKTQARKIRSDRQHDVFARVETAKRELAQLIRQINEAKEQKQGLYDEKTSEARTALKQVELQIDSSRRELSNLLRQKLEASRPIDQLHEEAKVIKKRLQAKEEAVDRKQTEIKEAQKVLDKVSKEIEKTSEVLNNREKQIATREIELDAGLKQLNADRLSARNLEEAFEAESKERMDRLNAFEKELITDRNIVKDIQLSFDDREKDLEGKIKALKSERAKLSAAKKSYGGKR